MAQATSPKFHITLYNIDLDKWRIMNRMLGATDRAVLRSIKDHADKHLNEHFERLGITAWTDEPTEGCPQ